MEKVIVSFVEENEKFKDRLRRYYDLVLGLALRDVKVRYQLSLLGLYWAVLNPLLMALIWSFVFTQVFNARGPSGIPYVVFLFCNFTFWNLFANSLLTAVNCLTGNAGLLAKLYFPRIIMPTSSVMARLVDFSFSLIVVIGLLLYFKIIPERELMVAANPVNFTINFYSGDGLYCGLLKRALPGCQPDYEHPAPVLDVSVTRFIYNQSDTEAPASLLSLQSHWSISKHGKRHYSRKQKYRSLCFRDHNGNLGLCVCYRAPSISLVGAGLRGGYVNGDHRGA